ncbi:MAG: 4Fe-4S dicluster domain-containing protein [Candidatus Brockarchaeota archaeon]|nr:4Fe-4S dicluster domain-containing protein [Candidatus Brockarchaeota archaeon]
MDAEERVRSIARELLSKKEVECFIGFENGSIRGASRPCFVRDESQVDKLVWNRYCRSNLARYLVGATGKVGILAKGCDGATILQMILENQVKRESVYIVAVECGGVEKPEAPYSIEPKHELAEHCKRCSANVSPVYDILISTGEKKPQRKETAPWGDPKDWFSEFETCVRCMACIRSCPLCYCTECALSGSKPWLVSKISLKEELATFHLVRALHMAGRCTECGACEMACPARIPLTRLYHLVNEKVEPELGRLAEAGKGRERLASALVGENVARRSG